MNEDYSTKQHTAKERYEKLREKREQYLDRARECSEPVSYTHLRAHETS